jgi:Zn-dependent peptidase ImmA (M78 family)
MSTKKVEQKIETFIEGALDNPLFKSLPIKVEDIAKSMGIKVLAYGFDDDISGVLVINDEGATIGYNQTESRVRKRFTIAHELGHYVLHRDQSDVFMDKQYKALFRSPGFTYTEQSQKLEQEANKFAACILMPEKLLNNEIEKMEFDLHSEDDIKHLAKIFDVSATSMSFRLSNLGYKFF